MTEATGREMILDEAYKEIAPFYLENGTYLVNGLVSGLHQDVLTIMEETLNFTTLQTEGSGMGFCQCPSR